MSKKLTQEEILSQFIAVHGNKYNYSKFIYINTIIKGIIICPVHGEFLQAPYAHKKGADCPKCSTNYKLTTDQLFDQFRHVHGNKYSYIKFIHINNIIKGIIICPEHGEFLQNANIHKSGKGCPTCGLLNKRTTKLSNEIVFQQFRKAHADRYSYKKFIYINDTTKGIIICPDHGEFLQTPQSHKNGSGCPNCNTNKKEKFLTELLEEYQIPYTYQDRTLIGPKEIDILVPDYKFGIEHNGLVWHSFGKDNWSALDNYHLLDKKRHLIKTIETEEKGYQLFHIREDHILNPQKKDIWKSMILNKCRISHKIHARKLQVVDLSGQNDFIRDFLETNHLQGYGVSKIKLGLQDPKTGIIYSIMTFGRSRFNKNIQWELLRFCNLKFHNVRGAASKLLKAFERWVNPVSIVSYANRDWSQGNLYKALGFTFSHASEPNYIYTNVNNEIIPRQSVQKHKLEKFFAARDQPFQPELSERDNMINNGYRIFYDTGNLVFHKFYNKGEN